MYAAQSNRATVEVSLNAASIEREQVHAESVLRIFVPQCTICSYSGVQCRGSFEKFILKGTAVHRSRGNSEVVHPSGALMSQTSSRKSC